MTHHPIRDLEIWTFIGVHGALAFFEDGKQFPVMARGVTTAEAKEKLETLRAKIIAENEPAMIARAEAKAAREAEKAAKEQVTA